MSKPYRRIVTGHNAQGRSIIASDGPPERLQAMGPNGPWLCEYWNTRETPAIIDRFGGEPPEARVILAPPPRGTRIRVVDIAPENAEDAALDRKTASEHFARIGAADAFTGGLHPMMHRTETIDYGIVLEGEVTLIVDESEVLVRAGDIAIQRGTNHAWVNRSTANCRIAFVLIDGVFADGLRRQGI
jgi:mannose-6-phosphate isomerase-like protein (cupin superfamily)